MATCIIRIKHKWEDIKGFIDKCGYFSSKQVVMTTEEALEAEHLFYKDDDRTEWAEKIIESN